MDVFGQVAHFPKPTIAAIEGAAIGGGLELAAACDFVVASRRSRLALPEINLGAFPGSGGTVRITQRIGPGRARRMMLLGDFVDATTAQAWGLVDELCDEGDAFAVGMRLAQRLEAGPALAYEGCKAAIDAALEGDEAAALNLAARWAVRLGMSEDVAEGLLALGERRKPKFARSGR
jgi:enoyl-CoA hydratase/carnithine racemase